jgi:hypothetical protein
MDDDCLTGGLVEMVDPKYYTKWQVSESDFVVRNTKSNNDNNIKRLESIRSTVKDIIIMNKSVQKNTNKVSNIDERLILSKMNAN